MTFETWCQKNGLIFTKFKHFFSFRSTFNGVQTQTKITLIFFLKVQYVCFKIKIYHIEMKSILSEKSCNNQLKCEVVSRFHSKSFSNRMHFENLSPHMHRTYLQMNLLFTIAKRRQLVGVFLSITMMGTDAFWRRIGISVSQVLNCPCVTIITNAGSSIIMVYSVKL